MTKFFFAGVVGAIVQGAVSQPPSDQTNNFVVVLVAVLGGGLISSAVAAWRYKKQGQQERDTLIGEAAEAAVTASKEMLAEYRQELQEAKIAITNLNKQLQESNERIARLEQELKKSNKDRDRL